MGKLLINKDSWHYQYWSWLRTFWGADDLPAQTSLCPYCQTMLWLSVWTFLVSPFLLAGWLFKKTTRYSYVQLVERGLDNAVNFIDSFWFFRVTEKFATAGEDVAAWNCLANAFLFITLCISSVMLFGIFTYGIMFLPLGIWYAVCGITKVVLYAGWGITWAMAFVGAILVMAAQGIAWLFTAGWLWERVCEVVGYGFLGIVGSALTTFSGYHILTSPLAMRVWQWTSFKFNGYVDARAKAEWHRKERQWQIEKGEIPAPPPSKFAIVWDKVWGAIATGCEKFNNVVGDFFISAKVEWNGSTAKVLSPMAAMWTFLVALKKGACPLVEFVDGDKLPQPEVPAVDTPAPVADEQPVVPVVDTPATPEPPTTEVKSMTAETVVEPPKETWENEPQNTDVQNIVKEEPKPCSDWMCGEIHNCTPENPQN